MSAAARHGVSSRVEGANCDPGTGHQVVDGARGGDATRAPSDRGQQTGQDPPHHDSGRQFVVVGDCDKSPQHLLGFSTGERRRAAALVVAGCDDEIIEIVDVTAGDAPRTGAADRCGIGAHPMPVGIERAAHGTTRGIGSEALAACGSLTSARRSASDVMWVSGGRIDVA